MARLSKLFSFTNWAASRPKLPLPGQEVDREFAEVRKTVNEIDQELAQVRRADGKLQNGIVDEPALAPGLLAKIKSDANAAVAPAVQAASAINGTLHVMEANALDAAQRAEAAAAQAKASERILDANTGSVLAEVADARTKTNADLVESRALVVGTTSSAQASQAAAKLSGTYAKLSSYWAEWMGADGRHDQTIPPNILSEMGVTGDHWSARWWANRASNAFGALTALYLGIHPDHATATAASAGPLAPGAIYFNSTDKKPYIWSGAGWTPFWAPQKAITTTLIYKSIKGQTVFPLGSADLFNNSFTLDKTDVEPLDIYVNGVRVLRNVGSPSTDGDYSIDPTNNLITFDEPLPANAVVTIDVLTPRDKFAVGSVNFHSLINLDLDPVTMAPGRQDGVNTAFTLGRVDGKPLAIGNAQEVFISIDGVIQEPGASYNVVGSRITFTDAPAKDSKVWMLWMEPGGGGSGRGVNPPPAPMDLLSARYDWHPGVGGEWVDDRGVHSVADAAGRMGLKDPENLIPGSLVFERDTRNLWVYTPVAAPATPAGTGTTGAPAPGTTPAGDPTKTSNWMLLLPGHPVDNILRALEYDPSKPNSMAWEDARTDPETVPTELDLLNRAVLPASHLAVGKLIYARDTGLLYECLVDGLTGTVTGTMADFKTLGGAGVTFVGRIGNLPDPTVKTIPDGSLFMVNMDLLGNEYHRLYVFDAAGTNAAGVVGIFRPCATKDFIKSLRSDADQGLDAEVGDLQVTLEAGHKELKAYDAAGAWQTVYSEDQTKAWIAAGNLFQGTVEEVGHGVAGAVELARITAQSALGITDSGHYHTWVGQPGYVVKAGDIGGQPSAIDGARLNPGDWLQIANTGTAAAPVMRWTHIPGDLLAKARGDALYGLNNWVAGAYEQGSLVCFNGDIYKASQPVLATDIAPGATPTTPGATNPWAKVNISGGVKTVASDTNLPAGAANGAVYLVLSSAQAGGKGAMYMWDQAAAKWQALGGGGVPMSLTGGKKLINYGTPIGTVIQFAGKTLPAGYLLCDGSTFQQTVYPELFKVLGGNTLPDLRDQFIRGARTLADVSFVKHDATTGMPKTHFTGVTNSTGSHTHSTDSQGEHRHNVGFSMSNHNWKGGGSWTGDATCNFSQDGGAASSSAGGHTHNVLSAGAHTHSVEIQSGGDAETAPAHVVLCFLVKADDVGIRQAP